MLLNVKKKRVIFISSLVVALVTVFVGTSASREFNTNADPAPTTTAITITKNWTQDEPGNRPESINVYVKKKISTLITGKALNEKMKSLAGSIAASGELDTNITAFKVANDEQYDAVKGDLGPVNEVQASGEETYMWYDDSDGTIYIYSKTGAIYAGANFGETFRKMANLTDISGAAAINTTHVTDMNRLFQDSSSITDLTPIANWYTGNVTDMMFMFGGNTNTDLGTENCIYLMSFDSLAPIAGWDVSNVSSMNQMFKCNVGYTDLSAISGWTVSNVEDMNQMFNQSAIEDASAIADWDVARVKGDSTTTGYGNNGFFKMFYGAPVDEFLADQVNWFSKRDGEWIKIQTGDKKSSYYLPSDGPASGVVPTDPIPYTPDQQVCSGVTTTGERNKWTKDDANNVWTCTVIVANDGASYIAWEDQIRNYNEVNSYYVDNPVAVSGNQATFTNEYDPTDYHDITLGKQVSGDAASTDKVFTFVAKVYNEGGYEVPSFTKTVSLKHGESDALFSIPGGYSYTVNESNSGYSASYAVNKASDGSLVVGGDGASTGRITPSESQVVLFTNVKTNDLTKKVTLIKEWIGDSSESSFVRPADITAHLERTVSELPTGNTIKNTIIGLAGGASNVTKILKADKTQCDSHKSLATNIATGGEPTYMWYNSNAIYICSDADNVYANANMQRAFNGFSNLTDISGLSIFNTTYVTDMAGMFQNSTKINDLSPLQDWDTGNVTSMRVMFGADVNGSSPASDFMSIDSVAPLATWNTQSVTDMKMMFKGCLALTDSSPIKNWNVQNVAEVNQMFMRSGLTDATSLGNWQLVRVGQSYTNTLTGATVAAGDFNQMFANLRNATTSVSILPIYNGVPGFQGRPGTWASSGKLTPTSGPESGLAPTSNKTRDAQNQWTCGGSGSSAASWDKTKDSEGIWTCEITISNDGSIFTAWEDATTIPSYYVGSNTSSGDAAEMSGDVATITNTLQKHTITLKKVVTGNLADINETFNMSVKVYTGSHASGYIEVEDYIASADQPALKHGEDFTFMIPNGWSYQISETDTDYNESFEVITTMDSHPISSGQSYYTGIITPNVDHTATFTNNKESPVVTGIFDDHYPFAIIIAALIGGLVSIASFYLIETAKQEKKGG